MNSLSYHRYHTKVFNEAVLTCLSKLHQDVLGETDDPSLTKMADSMCRGFFKDCMNLDKNTMKRTKENLSESCTFMKDIITLAESIADAKADQAAEDEMEFDDDDDVELSPEDDALIDTLFDEKQPTMQVDQIRNATVQALLAEEKKSEEIRNAVDLAKANVSDTDSPQKSLEETVNRISGVGPTSLMNAIINRTSILAVNDVTNNGNFVSVAKTMSENAEAIKDRSMMLYALYEAASVLGIKKFSKQDIEEISRNFYYGR